MAKLLVYLVMAVAINLSSVTALKCYQCSMCQTSNTPPNQIEHIDERKEKECTICYKQIDGEKVTKNCFPAGIPTNFTVGTCQKKETSTICTCKTNLCNAANLPNMPVLLIVITAALSMYF